MVCGGSKTNTVPDSCELDVDIRALPGQDREYLNREINSIIENTELEIPLYQPPTFSGMDIPYYRLISEIMKDSLGDVLVLPVISPGATDARFLRRAGMACYGISTMALDLDPGMRKSVHGPDEKIDIASLKLKTEFLTSLAEKYLGRQD